MKKWGYLFLFLIMTNTQVISQTTPEDTSDHKRHAIEWYPLSLLALSLGFNYEYLVVQKHGLFLEGSYTPPLRANNKGYYAGIHYRYHFHKRMNSNFIGVFYRSGYMESSFKNVENRQTTTYDYSLKFNIAGVNYGWRSRFFKTRFNYDFRVGLGVPISTLTWGENGKPGSIGGVMSASTLEKFIKYSSIMDLDFAVGYSF